MTEILEYITANYTWFLGGAIIILLAIIGSYADKTNFGQGKKNIEKSDEPETPKLENKRLSEYINISSTEKDNINSNHSDNNTNILNNNALLEDNKKDNDNFIENSDLSTNNNISDEVQTKLNESDIIFEVPSPIVETYNNKNEDTSFEDSYNKLDEEFNAILPKKEIIENDLLDDIDNLSLDKTQKFNPDSIPDLDDVELPEINKIGKSEQNIWKF